MTNIKSLFIFLPLLMLACTLTVQMTPPPNDTRGMVIVQTFKPTEQPQTASITPAPFICHVKTGIDAGSLNLRNCGDIECPVLIVLHEGETITQTKQEPINEWIEVITAGGLHGWLNSTYTDCEVTNE